MFETTWLAVLALLGGGGVVVARRVVLALLARFDDRVMRVEPLRCAAPFKASLADGQQRDWERLHAWCLDGVGDGRSPFLRPWVLPHVEKRFAFALLSEGLATSPGATIESLCWHLDGSDQLAAAGGAVAGLWLRLRVKFRDVLWWRTREPADPWDCGHLIGTPEGLRALHQFRPRRATLMVALGLEETVWREAQRTLESNHAQFAHPVRLLVLSGSGAMPSAPSGATG